MLTPRLVWLSRRVVFELRSSYFVIMIVFDASTLILIAKIELLDRFLTNIELEVAVPAEVARECCGAKKTLDALMIQKGMDDARVKAKVVKDKKVVSKLQTDFSLGRGEAEAIALALKEKAQLVGIDDKNGINACKLLGLGFTTALAILVRSHEKAVIDRNDALAKLAALARDGRHKDSLVDDARSKLEAQE
jgi:predicted nucleic acid-binding protein